MEMLSFLSVCSTDVIRRALPFDRQGAEVTAESIKSSEWKPVINSLFIFAIIGRRERLRRATNRSGVSSECKRKSAVIIAAHCSSTSISLHN